LNHRHSSPVQKAPLLWNDVVFVRTAGSWLWKLFRGRGKVRPPCALATAKRVDSVATTFILISHARQPGSGWSATSPRRSAVTKRANARASSATPAVRKGRRRKGWDDRACPLLISGYTDTRYLGTCTRDPSTGAISEGMLHQHYQVLVPEGTCTCGHKALGPLSSV